MLIPIVRANNTNYQLKSNNPTKISQLKFATNSLPAKTQACSIISFTAYRGAEFYGTPEVRNDLSYQIQLAPEKINTIMKNSKSTDEGLIAVYKELGEETKHVNKAFSSFDVIRDQYKIIANIRKRELSSSNPKFSKFPGMSIGSQSTSRLTGSFKNKIEKKSFDILEDCSCIIDKYFNNGIRSMLNDYIEINQYVLEGIEYVNMRQGKSNLRDNIHDKISRNQAKAAERYQSLGTSLDNLWDNLNHSYYKMMDKQDTKQSTRLVKKIGRKLVLLILSLA